MKSWRRSMATFKVSVVSLCLSFLFYTTLIFFLHHSCVSPSTVSPKFYIFLAAHYSLYSHLTNIPLLSAISRIISLFNCCWLKPSPYSPAAQHSSSPMLLQPRAIQLPLGRLNYTGRARTVWALNHWNTTLDGGQTSAPGMIKQSAAALLIWTRGDWEGSAVLYDNLLFFAFCSGIKYANPNPRQRVSWNLERSETERLSLKVGPKWTW